VIHESETDAPLAPIEKSVTKGSSFASLAANGHRILWIVSSGGHLVQATHIERLIGTHPDSFWITNDVPQARSLLAGRNVAYLEYVAPRDWRGAVRAAKLATRIARELNPDQVISTGAAIAGLALPRLALAGYPTTFVESVARQSSHSLTGKIAALSPGVRTLTQYANRADRRWTFDGTILANWRRRDAPVDSILSTGSLRVLVTLGTIRPYRFDSAIDAVLRILRPQDEVVWQLGDTARDDLPGSTHSAISNEELKKLIRWADVVVSHAGVGSIVDSLEAGKCPVLVVRRASRQEHVDDHQMDIAGEVENRGLGSTLVLDDPQREVLVRAALSQAVPVT
jgi:UDP-N-acetylglucosamine--N-acetylmuramyl-(pentapeptide) pyrophosphoryl-undecaprenol N-acetylglucosamine transferase